MADGKGPKQRLAAILAADVAGYSRLMQADERATIATLNEYRSLFRAEIETHDGRVVDMAGDSVLAVFDSAIGAVTAAVQIQGELAKRNVALPDDRRMAFRIGVNLGDIFEQADGTIYGDGVNVAARLEAIASPSGINVSGSVFDSVRSKVGVSFDFLGEQEVKNIAGPVRTYRVADGEEVRSDTPLRRSKRNLVIGLAAAASILVVGGLWGVGLFTAQAPDGREKSASALADVDSPAGRAPPSDKASVAVLPFQNLSTDPAHAFLADGLHENITSTLSQARRLFVPARFSTLQYKIPDVDIGIVARTLGVAHVLEGSVQVAGEQVRITMQLIDAATGGHIWTERYDRPLDDVFVLQDEITLDVVSALQVKLIEGAQALRWRGGTVNLEAWALAQSALVHIRRFNQEDHAEARALVERALQLDPDYALAWTLLGYIYQQIFDEGWVDDPSLLNQAQICAEKAIALDPNLPLAHTLIGFVALSRGNVDVAVAQAEKAIAIDPNGSISRMHLAIFLNVAGDPDKALSLIDEAMALSPIYPDFYLWNRAHALLLAGEYDEAADLFVKYQQRVPGDWPILTTIALAKAGRNEDAAAYIEEMMDETSGFSIDLARDQLDRRYPYKDQSILEGHLHTLRGLGVPEHPPRADADKPSIAVLPFVNLSGDPDQDYFAKGISEELITALGRFPALRVAARGTSREMTGQDPRRVAEALNVDFVLEGSVRKAGATVRVDASLEAADGTQVWAERFDRDLTATNLFAIQDDITSRVAAALASGRGAISAGVVARRARSRTADLSAYECYLRALASLQSPNPKRHTAARDCLEAAVAANPDFIDGWSALRWLYESEHVLGFNPRPRPLDRALDAARRVVALDPNHPKGLHGLASIHFMRRDLEQFFDTAERALRVNPNDTETLADLGWMIAYAGRWERGIKLLEQANEINPSIGKWIYIAYAIDKYRRRDYVGALADAQRAQMPDFRRDPFVTTIALAQVGRIDDAKVSLARMLELHPEFADDPWGECRKWNWSEDLIADILDGFEKAGLQIPPDPAG